MNTRQSASIPIHIPNATVQQSLLVSPSAGSMVATAVSFCRVSHTLTLPSLLPVTSSGAPPPIPSPPQPSIELMISECPLTE